MSDSGSINWSAETYTLAQLERELPCIVRVSEGVYSADETESFSIGDILWLEKKQTIHKISAQAVDISDWSVEKEELLIPQAFKGPVKVLIPPTLVKSTNLISRLVNASPRYVRVDKDFTSPCGMRFAQDSLFEVERILPKKSLNKENSLIVKYQDRQASLPFSLEGLFTPIEDFNVYTLKDVVERYPLPQYIKFLGDEIQHIMTTDMEEAISNVRSYRKHGVFRLSSIEPSSVIVGHVKLASYDVDKTQSTFCQRNGVILPLSKGIMSDIEFQTSVYSEPSDYEMILARNFSRCVKFGEQQVETLYVEYKKKPRIHIIPAATINTGNRPEESAKRNEVPLPPRMKDIKTKNTTTSDSTRKKIPPVNTKKNSSADEDVYELQDAYKISSIADVFTSEAGRDSCTGKETLPHMAKRKGMEVMSAVKQDIVTLKKKLSTAHASNKPKKKLSVDRTSLHSSDDEVMYDYPDISKMEDFSEGNKPAGKVSPTIQTPTHEQTLNNDLHDFSVDKLSRELTICGLNALADICRNERIDGSFFCSLSDKMLMEPPFELNSLNLKKVNRMKDGWRPKLS